MKGIEGTDLGEKFEIAKLIEATKQVIQKLKIIFHHICLNARFVQISTDDIAKFSKDIRPKRELSAIKDRVQLNGI